MDTRAGSEVLAMGKNITDWASGRAVLQFTKRPRCGQSKQGGQSKTVSRQKGNTVPALPRKDVWLGSV